MLNAALSSSILGTDFPERHKGSAFVPSLSVTHTTICAWLTLGEQRLTNTTSTTANLINCERATKSSKESKLR